MNPRTSYPHFSILTIFAALVCLAVFAGPAAAVPITIEDGSSNTLQVGESGITDGTSNTISVGEDPIGNPGGIGGGPGSITDGTSNTISVGENVMGNLPGSGGSRGPGSITDGTSNTIDVGETPAHGVPDGGGTATLLAAALLATIYLRHRTSMA